MSCLEHFARQKALSWTTTKHGRYATGTTPATPFVLATTLSWMNQTGLALPSLLSLYKSSPQNLIVIHDDLDLDLGSLRIKRQGSAGGHNGVQSIIEALHTTEFCRLKIGIGKPRDGEEVSEFVLSPFSQEEELTVSQVIEQATSALDCLLEAGVEAAMNQYNVRRVVE